LAIGVVEVVSDAADLISWPEATLKVNSLVNDPESSADDIGQAMSADPALTARLLQLANSAFYGFPTEIDSIVKAVTVIGMTRIRDIVIGMSAKPAFADLSNELYSLDDFWHHSLNCAITAKTVATELGWRNVDSVFVIGLLHDIGRLAVLHALPELSRQVIWEYLEGPDKALLVDVEREILGFDHAQAGHALASHWGFPESLIAAIAYHHDPGACKPNRKEAYLVHLADGLASMLELEDEAEEDLPPLSAEVWDEVGISVADALALLPSISEHVEEYSKMLGFTDS